MIKTEYFNKTRCDELRNSKNEYCELTGLKTNKLVVDHIHTGESEIAGHDSDFNGCIRGVINHNSNITLGYLMSDCKKMNLNINEYLNMIKLFLEKEPTNKIYHLHPRQLLDEFILLTEDEQINLLEYEVGICTSDDYIDQYKKYLKEEYEIRLLK